MLHGGKAPGLNVVVHQTRRIAKSFEMEKEAKDEELNVRVLSFGGDERRRFKVVNCRSLISRFPRKVCLWEDCLRRLLPPWIDFIPAKLRRNTWKLLIMVLPELAIAELDEVKKSSSSSCLLQRFIASSIKRLFLSDKTRIERCHKN